MNVDARARQKDRMEKKRKVGAAGKEIEGLERGGKKVGRTGRSREGWMKERRKEHANNMGELEEADGRYR